MATQHQGHVAQKYVEEKGKSIIKLQKLNKTLTSVFKYTNNVKYADVKKEKRKL